MEIIYSLERHLKAWGEIDSKYKRLDEIYAYNKVLIKDTLDETDRYFSFYSRHDSTHSETLISSIESLLGENRIKQLSPTDTLLILLAAYLHDFGMCLQYQEIKEMLASGAFNKFVEDLSNNKYYKPYTSWFKDGDFSVQYFNEKNWPLDTITCVSVLLSEFYRSKHGENSEKAINNNFTGHEININPYKHLPERLEIVLGKICSLHTKDFSDVMLLDQESNGAYNDKIHPRFIAVLIRIADLLDLDNNRFSQIKLATICEDMPQISKIHYNKHKSVKSFLVTPQKINIVAESDDDEALREMRKWIEYLESELKNAGEHWNEIIPSNFEISLPKLVTRVVKSNAEITFSEKNLKLNLPEKKAFQIIQGANIYSHNLVFIRECIQNSLDALKIQFWQEQVDSYDNFNASSKPESLEKINKEITENYFSGELDTIIKQYGVKLRIFDCRNKEELEVFKDYFNSINYKADDFDKRIVVVIEDNGAGISADAFQKRILNVGKKDIYKDDDYEKAREEMPAFLKPTGNFGIGLHSSFLVTDKIILHTRTTYDQHQGIEIIIESGEKTGYVQCNKWEPYSNKRGLRRGTQSIISIEPQNIIISEQHAKEPYQYKFPFPKSNSDFLVDYILQVAKSVIKKPFFGVKFLKYNNEVLGFIPPEKQNQLNNHEELFSSVVTKDNIIYRIQISKGTDSHQKYLLKVYDTNEGHSLELYLRNTWDKGVSVIALYKGILLKSLELDSVLKNYLLRGSEAIINFSLKETAKYITIDREHVTTLGREKFEKIFERLVFIGLEQIPCYLISKYGADNRIEAYIQSRRILEPITTSHIEELNKLLSEPRTSGDLESFCFSSHEESLHLKELVTEYGNIPVQVYVNLLANKIWDVEDNYRDYTLQGELRKIRNTFFKAVYTYWEQLGVTEIEDAALSKEYLECLINVLAGRIGGYALDFLYIRNPKLMFDMTYINKSGQNQNMKTYFDNNFPALGVFLYHVKYGQNYLMDEKYRKILEVLADTYIHDTEYGIHSDEELNIFCDIFLYRLVNTEESQVMKPVKFGSEAIQYFNQLFIIPEKIFENSENSIIAIYPIRSIELYPGNNNDTEYYANLSFMQAGQKSKSGIKCIGKYTKDYWFSDIIKQDYTDVEEYGNVFFNNLNMYCIPALEEYKYIAVNKLPYEFHKIYKISRFKYINQDSYIMVPIERKQIETWEELFTGSSTEFEELINNCKDRLLKDNIASDMNFYKEVMLHKINNDQYAWNYIESYYTENNIDIYSLFLNSCKNIILSEAFLELVEYTYENRSFIHQQDSIEDAKIKITNDYLYLLKAIFLYIINYFYPAN